MDTMQYFRETYYFREIMSNRKPKKEEGEPIKVPEYVKRFREEYNIIKIKGEKGMSHSR
jgi:hypothetical protein